MNNARPLRFRQIPGHDAVVFGKRHMRVPPWHEVFQLVYELRGIQRRFGEDRFDVEILGV